MGKKERISKYDKDTIILSCNCYDPDCYLKIETMIKKPNKYWDNVTISLGERRILSYHNLLERIWDAIKLIFKKLEYENDVCIESPELKDFIEKLQVTYDNITREVKNEDK